MEPQTQYLRPIKGYCLYMAMKLHFSTKAYDMFEQDGKVWIKPETFETRNDVNLFIHLSTTIPKKDIFQYLLANFVDGNSRLIYDLNSGPSFYRNWKKRIDSISFQFQKDLDELSSELVSLGRPAEYIFDMDAEGRQHPLILRHYIGGIISAETMCILEGMFGYVEKFDNGLRKNDIMWKKKRNTIVKYIAFFYRGTIKIDSTKINKLWLDFVEYNRYNTSSFLMDTPLSNNIDH